MKDLSLEELAKKFKQQGDTCTLASMLFATAMLYRNSSYINQRLLKDIELILTDNKGYRKLEHRIAQLSSFNPNLVAPLMVKDVSEYLSLNGYEVKKHGATRNKIIETIEDNPIITIQFGFPEWCDFYGLGNLNDWYSSHVICAVGIKKWNLVYFEPLIGEIKEKNLLDCNNIIEIVTIIPKAYRTEEMRVS